MKTRSEDGRSGLILQAVLSVLVFLAVLATLVWSGSTSVDEAPSEVTYADAVLTNVSQLSDLFLQGWTYPQAWPWQPVMFEPALVVWTDTQALPRELRPLQDSLSELVAGVPAWPLWLTLYPQSGEIVIFKPWSDAEMARLPVPPRFPAWRIYEENLRITCLLSGMNPTPWEELVRQGYAYFAPPQVVLHAHLADVRDAPAYWANLVAAAREFEEELLKLQGGPTVAPEFGVASLQPAGEEGGGGEMLLLEGECQSDDEAPFVIEAIARLTNGWTEITFTTCTDRVYAVQSADGLRTNTAWQTREVWVGLNEIKTWTDETTAEVTNRFYRVPRLTFAGDFDNDGLSNLDEFQTHGTDPTHADTDGDGAADGWELAQGFDPLDPADGALDADSDGLSNAGEYAYGSDPHDSDTDRDFWMDGAEVAGGFNPVDDGSVPPFTVLINAGATATTSTVWQVAMPDGLVADQMALAQDADFPTGATNQFAESFTYTLSTSSNGFRAVYIHLLKNSGESVVVRGAILLDTAAPSVSFTSPTNGVLTSKRRLLLEGLAADAADVPPQQDADKWLQVRVNDNAVNGRTNGSWWFGPQDLLPGTNVFTAVATDIAGWTATNSIQVIYDPSLATNTPAFTVSTTNTVVVGTNTTDFALTGWIDDENAIVRVDVLDAGDTTVTNATIYPAVHGTNWWTQIPIFGGTNLIVITAANGGSATVTQSVTIVQSTTHTLEVTSPPAYEAVNASSVTVTGLASLSLSNATFRINGQTATTTVSTNEVTFASSAPLSLGAEVNEILVEAELPGGETVTGDQLVYRYEVVGYHEVLDDDWGHADDNCWYVQNFPHSHPYRGPSFGQLDWDAPAAQLTSAGDSGIYAYAGDCLSPACGPGSHSSTWDPEYIWVDGMGWWHTTSVIDGKHLEPTYKDFSNCVSAATNCIDTVEHTFWNGRYQAKLSFIKHWPVDEEQTVLLHFNDVYYWKPPAPFWQGGSEPEQFTFWGQPGLFHSLTDWLSTNVAFLVKIRTNTRYTIGEDDFTYPTVSGTFVSKWPNAQSPVTEHTTVHMLQFEGVGNSEARGVECIIDPEWHHLLPQKSTLKPFFESIQKPGGGSVIINDPEFGWILDIKDHRTGEDGLHKIIGSRGKDWIEEWEEWKGGFPPDYTPTWNELQTKLTALKNDTKFKQILDRGKQAAHSYSTWAGNAAAREEFIGLLAAERGVKVAKFVRKSGRVVGRVIRRGAAIVGVVLIAVDVASAEDASQLVEKIKDNAPGTGDYRMAEEILNEVGYYSFWGSIGHILGLASTPQELYDQYLLNFELLWGDSILTPDSILPW